MSFQITLKERDGVNWVLSRAPSWPKFLGIDEGFAEGTALDIAQPPLDRDWVGERGSESAKVFFEDEASARVALTEIVGQGWTSAEVSVVPEKDWNEEWKKSFEGTVAGPWHVIPPWKTQGAGPVPNLVPLVIEPGAGFGTGTHETTKLCLEDLSEIDLKEKQVLDFGSGSGILSIAAALQGARVCGVEIDPHAVENARHNAELNSVNSKIQFQSSFPQNAVFDVVVANILRPVLIEFAPKLVNALKPYGTLILSGLLNDDVESVQRRFEPLMTGRTDLGGEATVRSMTRFAGDWRALTFAKLERIQRPVSLR